MSTYSSIHPAWCNIEKSIRKALEDVQDIRENNPMLPKKQNSVFNSVFFRNMNTTSVILFETKPGLEIKTPTSSNVIRLFRYMLFAGGLTKAQLSKLEKICTTIVRYLAENKTPLIWVCTNEKDIEYLKQVLGGQLFDIQPYLDADFLDDMPVNPSSHYLVRQGDKEIVKRLAKKLHLPF